MVDFSKYGIPIQAKISQPSADISPSIKSSPISAVPDFSKYGIPVKSSTQSSLRTNAPQSDVKGGLAGEILTGNTQRFGQTIGEALAAPGNADLYAENLQQHTKIQNDLLKAIQAKKKMGQDTSRLETALQHHVESTPKLEDFTGDVINKSAEQVIGEGIGTGLEALSGGVLGEGAGAVASKTLSTGEKIKDLAKVGATYGAIGGTSSAMQDNSSLGGVLGNAALSGAIGGATGAGLGALGAGAGKLAKLGGGKAQDASKITGEILQGEAKDIPRGQKVLKAIDTSGIKTYADGVNALNQHIENLSAQQDDLLSKDTSPRKAKDLGLSMTVGNKTIKNNYVTDAINQLDNFYKKTGNVVEEEKLSQLKSKAKTEGLNSKEVNDLARTHGRTLNGYNANGELASGLSKQAAENTRAGLKNTVRQFGGKESEQIDKNISDAIRVRDLFQNTAEKVNTLQQKIQQRSLGEKAGYLAGKAINFIGMGSPKGIVEAMIPRGQGLKVLNALDLESKLQKNLKILTDIGDKKVPESTLIERLEKFLNQNVNQKSLSSDLSPPQINTTAKINQNILPNIPQKLNKGQVPLGVLGTIAAGTGLGVAMGKVGNSSEYDSGYKPKLPKNVPPVTEKEQPLDIPSEKNTIGNYNMSKYASNPKAISNMQRIYKDMPDVSTPEKAQAEIKRVSPNSKITGKMIVDYADKYDIEPKALLALLRNESNVGALGLGLKTNNAANILNTDDGKMNKKPTPEEGVEAGARELYRRRINKTTYGQ